MPIRPPAPVVAGVAVAAAIAVAAFASPAAVSDPAVYDLTAHPPNARTGAPVQLAIAAGRADRWEADVDGDGFDDGGGRADADGVAELGVRFARDGVHHVRVRITPRHGRPVILTRVYATRSANLPPAVELGFGPSQQLVPGQPLVLLATAGDDTGAPVRDLRWDVDADGAFDDARGERPAPIADPGLPRGRHRLRVRAVDADGAATVATLRLDVVRERRPEIVTSRIARVGAPAPLHALRLSGEGRWDLDGDGAFDDRRGHAHGAPVWTPTAPGTRVLRLRDTATGAVVSRTVRVAAGNQAPVGRILARARVRALENLDLIAFHHDDVWTGRARVTWDLDGDGAFDDGVGGGVTYAWAAPGARRVRARVEDGDGLATTLARRIVVTPLGGR